MTSDLALRLKTLFPNIDLGDEVIIQNDGDGEYIAAWHRAEPKPSDAELLAAPPSPNQAIDAQIAALEGKTERGVREAMIYTLVAIAASQGITEAQLYASNFGYRKAKDLDTQIAALRAQRV